jgi:hypothetical protein
LVTYPQILYRPLQHPFCHHIRYRFAEHVRGYTGGSRNPAIALDFPNGHRDCHLGGKDIPVSARNRPLLAKSALWLFLAPALDAAKAQAGWLSGENSNTPENGSILVVL